MSKAKGKSASKKTAAKKPAAKKAGKNPPPKRRKKGAMARRIYTVRSKNRSGPGGKTTDFYVWNEYNGTYDPVTGDIDPTPASFDYVLQDGDIILCEWNGTTVEAFTIEVNDPTDGVISNDTEYNPAGDGEVAVDQAAFADYEQYYDENTAPVYEITDEITIGIQG